MLPDLTAELLRAQVVKCYVIQENRTARLRWFGLSGFVDQKYLSYALGSSGVPFRRALLEAALDGGTPFLNRRQVASANAADSMILTVVVCQPDIGEYTDEQGGLLFRMAYESFCFAHAGYGLAEFWQEVADPKRCKILEGSGAFAPSVHRNRRRVPAFPAQL